MILANLEDVIRSESSHELGSRSRFSCSRMPAMSSSMPLSSSSSSSSSSSCSECRRGAFVLPFVFAIKTQVLLRSEGGLQVLRSDKILFVNLKI